MFARLKRHPPQQTLQDSARRQRRLWSARPRPHEKRPTRRCPRHRPPPRPPRPSAAAACSQWTRCCAAATAAPWRCGRWSSLQGRRWRQLHPTVRGSCSSNRLRGTVPAFVALLSLTVNTGLRPLGSHPGSDSCPNPHCIACGGLCSWESTRHPVHSGEHRATDTRAERIRGRASSGGEGVARECAERWRRSRRGRRLVAWASARGAAAGGQAAAAREAAGAGSAVGQLCR